MLLARRISGQRPLKRAEMASSTDIHPIPFNLNLIPPQNPHDGRFDAPTIGAEQKPEVEETTTLPPQPFVSKSAPTSNLDPSDQYKIWQFSSFSGAVAQLGKQLKRRREKKDKRASECAKKSKRDGEVIKAEQGLGLDVVVATTPKKHSRRAGLAGVDMKRYKPSASSFFTPPPSTSPEPAAASCSSVASTSGGTIDAGYEGIIDEVKRESEARDAGLPSPSPTPSPSPSPSPSFDEPLSNALQTSPPSPTPSATPSTPVSEVERRQKVEARLVEGDSSLRGFTFSHRSGVPGRATTFVDETRRSFATRIECPKSMSNLSDQLCRDVESISSNLTNKISLMKTDGSRGQHEIRQIGLHREMGAKVGYSGAFRTGINKWTTFMRRPGFARARGHVSRCLESHYPKLFDYHRTLAEGLATFNLWFLFGAFASFCLNTGGRVACLPHRDQHNLGPGLCGIVAFGDFDSSRSGWCILWEAQLCVEVGPGDTFLFPSAVFTHSNTAIAETDNRNSLAFWCGASLFLWLECGMRCFNELPEKDQKAKLKNVVQDWQQAWERFPVL